jgi:LmbE family N-acetylglucosaminyl deacetylase
MGTPLRLMCILAHPDDESLGVGGTLAKYHAEGVETYLVTATRGERGRYPDGREHAGPDALGRIRESELRTAAGELGVREVQFLNYLDGELDQADPREAISRIVHHLRRVRPQVVITFGPDGAYGHPDHIAISQLATAATMATADPGLVLSSGNGAFPPHRVSKLYYVAWPERKWAAYQAAFKKLTITVEGVERQATPWPDWAISAVLDTQQHWPTVWRAVTKHESQMAIYNRLEDLSPDHHRGLWGSQEFYRVYSLVTPSRERETDLFHGLR